MRILVTWWVYFDRTIADPPDYESECTGGAPVFTHTLAHYNITYVVS